jgi:hypothetical protein
MAKKKHSSWKNYEDYRKGKAPLENAMLQHPEEGNSGNSVYDFMKGEIKRKLWVIPYDRFKKKDK